MVPWFYRESPATPAEVCSAFGIARYWDAIWLVSGDKSLTQHYKTKTETAARHGYSVEM